MCCVAIHAEEQTFANSKKVKQGPVSLREVEAVLGISRQDFMKLPPIEVIRKYPLTFVEDHHLAHSQAFAELFNSHFELNQKELLTPSKNEQSVEQNSENAQKLFYLKYLGLLNNQIALQNLIKTLPKLKYEEELEKTWGVMSYGGLGVGLSLIIFEYGNNETNTLLSKTFDSLPVDYQDAIVRAFTSNQFIAKLDQLPVLENLAKTANGLNNESKLKQSITSYIDRIRQNISKCDEQVLKEITNYPNLKSVIGSVP